VSVCVSDSRRGWGSGQRNGYLSLRAGLRSVCVCVSVNLCVSGPDDAAGGAGRPLDGRRFGVCVCVRVCCVCVFFVCFVCVMCV